MTPPTQQNIVPATDEQRAGWMEHIDHAWAMGAYQTALLMMNARIDAEVEEKKRLATAMMGAEVDLVHLSESRDMKTEVYDEIRSISMALQAVRNPFGYIVPSAQPAEQKMCSHSHIDRDGTCQICGKFLPASNVNLANEISSPAEVPEWMKHLMQQAGYAITFLSDIEPILLKLPTHRYAAQCNAINKALSSALMGLAPRPSASAVEGAKAAAKEILPDPELVFTINGLEASEMFSAADHERQANRQKIFSIILKHVAPSPDSESDANEAEEVHMAWIEAVSELSSEPLCCDPGETTEETISHIVAQIHDKLDSEREAVKRLVEAAKRAGDWLNKHSLMAGGILRELCEALPKQDGGSNV